MLDAVLGAVLCAVLFYPPTRRRGMVCRERALAFALSQSIYLNLSILGFYSCFCMFLLSFRGQWSCFMYFELRTNKNGRAQLMVMPTTSNSTAI